ARRRRTMDRGLRQSAVLLLYAPHPADPRARSHGRQAATWCSKPLALRQPSDGESPRARGVSMGTLVVVRRLGSRNRDSLFRLPMVRRSQEQEEQLVAQLSLTGGGRTGLPSSILYESCTLEPNPRG